MPVYFVLRSEGLKELKVKLIDSNLTKLSRAIGIPHSTLANALNGGRIGVPTMAKIIKYFGWKKADWDKKIAEHKYLYGNDLDLAKEEN